MTLLPMVLLQLLEYRRIGPIQLLGRMGRAEHGGRSSHDILQICHCALDRRHFPIFHLMHGRFSLLVHISHLRFSL